MHEKTVAEKSVVKRIQRQPQKATKPQSLSKQNPDDSDDDDEEQEDPKDPGDSDTEDALRAMGFPIEKSLEVGKNEEEPVLKKGIYRGKKLSYVAKFDTNYLKKMLTSSCVDKQTKEAIKQCLK